MDALATVEQLRHLSREPWSDPWRARQHLRSASDAVRGYCGWWIAPVRSVTVELDATGGLLLLLPAMYVTAVSEVLIDGVAVTDYRRSALGFLSRGGGWPDALGSVTVTFTAGLAEVPDDVVAAVCSVAGRLDVPGGISSERIEDQAVTYNRDSDPSGLTKREMAVLDRTGLVLPEKA